ncbi:peptide/nickel transport system ATP-binding protein [Cupriavidus sp. OV038]|jgi:oligopeptide/dipeptide ABC transporter ATP-binding protein|uniref:ABC transporter ATP-binding protein n=1 Tax=unclassified Cupriavidus TaxID=2640874 RepID=UPI0008E900D1|nr:MULTISPECIES: ABC transporter ATP-binding protein [unclassified Cupriavidus]SFD22949.1 peptide/nickel transport system ATP-binding protein [Cupriavidus sp. OV038]SFP92191.1 peptide/nickel transport system ATP-binding protein [Cupriavidus sp. OV096]
MTLLDVRALRTTFTTANGPVTALHDVSLHIDRGETLALVGESGSGKSVTAYSIMGLLPRRTARIAGGQALFDGTDLLALDARAIQDIRGNRIAMIFQEPMSALNPVMRIGDQIAEAIRLHRQVTRAQAAERAVGLLEQVRMPSPAARAGDYPHQLSGGMRQRAMIAIALACEPDLLIADEPTTALDVTTQAQILALLKRLQAETGMAMLLITHDLGVVAETADRAAVMYAGRIVEHGDVADLLSHPTHPYTAGLLASLAIEALPPGARLPEIPGTVPPLSAMPPGCAFAPRCAHALPRCRTEIPTLRREGGRQTACHAPLSLPVRSIPVLEEVAA